MTVAEGQAPHLTSMLHSAHERSAALRKAALLQAWQAGACPIFDSSQMQRRSISVGEVAKETTAEFEELREQLKANAK